MVSHSRARTCSARHFAFFTLHWLALFSTCCWLTSCAQEVPLEPEGFSTIVERGPFKLTVAAGPQEVWIGDPIRVDVRVHTPDGYLVRFPDVEGTDDLAIRDVKTGDPRPAADGGLEWRRSFTLEPLRSGELEIPPLAVGYGRKPADADAQPNFENELVARGTKVTVRSALTTQDSVQQPRDITGTLLPPRPPMSPWKMALIAGVVAAVLAGGYGAYRLIRRRRARPPPPVLPEIWALAALTELAGLDWFERGRVREYYYRLTEIVRRYIERQFGLAAPEMTTQEFLSTLAHNRSALPYDTERLRAFLEACDIVKYAAYHPLPKDAEEAMSAARAFIDATAVAVRQTGVPRAVDGDREPSGGQAA
jgi:hypothetical protein